MCHLHRVFGFRRVCLNWLYLLFGLLLTGSLKGQAWVGSVKQGSEVRFLFDSVVRRYDLTTRTWLSAVTLPRNGATALAWDEQGFYVAYGTAIYRYAPNLTGETILASVSGSVHGLFPDGNMLVAVHSSGSFSRLKMLDRTTGAQLPDSESDPLRLFGVSHATGLNRVFGRTQGISPSDIGYVEYSDAGRIGENRESPYHGVYPDASRTWVFPGEALVADSAGSLYLTSDLTYAGSLNGTVTDITFNGDVPVLLRGDVLIALTNALVETGRKTLAFAAGAAVHVGESSAFVFRSGSGNPLVEIVPLADLNARPPWEPLDPDSLSYTPHVVFKDRDDVIGLYSRIHKTVFRWSPALRTYTSPITLPMMPSVMAYSKVAHRLYMADGLAVQQMNAVPGALVSTFASLPKTVRGLGAAEEFVVIATADGTRSYDPSGTVLPGGLHYFGAWNEWDPVRRRMYHFSDGSSPNSLNYDTIDASGTITGSGQSPYREDSITVPIRVNPEGALIALGRGGIFRADGLARVADLRTTMTDMTWQGGQLVSIESGSPTVTRLQRWSATWERERSLLLNGAPLSMVPLSANRLLVITIHAGMPRFHLLDEALQPQFDSKDEPPVIVTQPMPARVDFRASVTLTTEAAGSPPLSYQWLKDGLPLPGQTGAALTITEAGSTDAGEYKVEVSNDFGTASSNSVVLSTGPVRSPLFTSGNLLVSAGGRVSEFTVTGIKRSEIIVPVPVPGTQSNRRVSDAVSDRFGRLHVFNEGSDIFNNPQYYISTFDPDPGKWTHSLTPGFILIDTTAGDLSIAGDWIYAREGRFNLTTGAFEKFNLPDSIVYTELSAGLDGRFYTCERFGEVNRLSPALSVLDRYQLGSGIDARGIGADAAGRIYMSDLSSRLGAYSETGSLIKWFTPAGNFGGFNDLSLSRDGRIAAGGRNGFVAVSDTSLNSSISIDSGIRSGSYTSWVAAVETPEPSLVATPAPPSAVEDVFFEWVPQVAHPDPDAVITLTAPVLPPWLTLSGSALRGTPLEIHTGPNIVRLRATDALGRFAEQDFTIHALQVNDTPEATNLRVAVDEDAAPMNVDITGLFSDEETPDSALGFQILTSSGTAVIPSLEGNSLRLAFPPDSFGSASVTVRATDAGGLTADSEIRISVRSVNDAPVFTAPLPEIDAGPAAPDATIDLRPLLRDPDPDDVHAWRILTVSNPDIFSSLTVDAAGRLAVRYDPYRSGSSAVTLEVSDAAGTTATLTFQVTLPELPAPLITGSEALTLNRQTGLWEHRVTLRNDAQRAIGGFEVRVTGLPAGASFYNASGDFPDTPLAGYYAPVAPGEAVTMILEYYDPSRQRMLSPGLLTSTTLPQKPPSDVAGGLSIDRLALIPGGLLLEFTAIPGHLYRVQYSNDGLLWLDSHVRIRAAGNRVQWLDQGPPRTISAPLSVTQRFYRVKEVSGP